MKPELRIDVAIIGAGTAGLYALREVRKAGRSFALIDHGPLGTTCARVGCMPSKVALHAGHLWSLRGELAAIGVSGTDALVLDTRKTWAAVRKQRDGFAKSGASKAREAAGEFLLTGTARFLEPTVLEVLGEDGKQLIHAKAVIIAVGSRPFVPKWLEPLGERVLTTDSLFDLDELPGSMGVLGLGAIGLEMGLALSRLGVRVTGADVASTIAGISDPVLAERAVARFGGELSMWLGTAAAVESSDDGLLLRSGEKEQTVDRVLASMGRIPNTDQLNLSAAGFPLDARGVPLFDPATMQVGNFPVFVAGDANGSRPLMHEAVDEGCIAGFNAGHGGAVRFRRKVPLGIAFTAPDIVAVGKRYDQLGLEETLVGVAQGASNGRSRILKAEDSLLRVYADRTTGELLGAAMMAAGGEHLAHLLAWAIQRGESAASLLEMPFYHPVLEEMLQAALQDIVGHLPDRGSLPSGLVLESA